MPTLFQPFLRFVPEIWVVGLLLLGIADASYEQAGYVLAASSFFAAVAVFRYGYDSTLRTCGKPLSVLTPCDGKIVFRRECHDPYLNREAIKVSIQLSLLARYVTRAPVEGELIPLPGVKGPVSCLETDEGEWVVLAVTHGSLLGAKPLMLSVGDKVGQARRCGLRRFARQIDVYLPLEARLEVSVGATVKSGLTPLATLLRKH